MKPVSKPPPTGGNAPKHPVTGATGMQRRYVKDAGLAALVANAKRKPGTPVRLPKKEGKKK